MRRTTTETRHDAVGVPGSALALRSHRVACCLASSEARHVAAAVVRRCGNEAVAIPPLEALRGLRHSGPWAALIHDLSPWDGEGVVQVLTVRREHPDLPILVYAPALVGVADFLVRCGALMGLRAEFQQRFTAEEIDRLHLLLVGLLAERPRARVMQMLRAVAPAAPPRTWAFAERALVHLGEERGPATLRVWSLARELGTSQRTLERAWRDTALPPPKEFLDWLALLLATVSAAAAGTTVAKAAQDLRIHSRHLYRLRRRLVPGHIPIPSLHPEQECDLVFLALIERCRGMQAALRTGHVSRVIA